MTWPLADTRIIACRLTGSKTSTSICGIFVLSSENSCCNENFGIILRSLGVRWKCLANVNDEDAFDLIGMPCSSKTPDTTDSSSSGDSVSHIFCIVSSTFQTRSVWSRDHVTNSMSEWSYERFGRQAKSNITSLWPRNEQIGALCFALFHSNKLFSPRPKFGTITVTKPSANGYEKNERNWNMLRSIWSFNIHSPYILLAKLATTWWLSFPHVVDYLCQNTWRFHLDWLSLDAFLAYDSNLFRVFCCNENLWISIINCSNEYFEWAVAYRAKCAVMYWMGHEPFRKSQIRKSPSCAVANRFPETRLKPTCVAPAEMCFSINKIFFVIFLKIIRFDDLTHADCTQWHRWFLWIT